MLHSDENLDESQADEDYFSQHVYKIPEPVVVVQPQQTTVNSPVTITAPVSLVSSLHTEKLPQASNLIEAKSEASPSESINSNKLLSDSVQNIDDSNDDDDDVEKVEEVVEEVVVDERENNKEMPSEIKADPETVPESRPDSEDKKESVVSSKISSLF